MSRLADAQKTFNDALAALESAVESGALQRHSAAPLDDGGSQTMAPDPKLLSELDSIESRVAQAIGMIEAALDQSGSGTGEDSGK